MSGLDIHSSCKAIYWCDTGFSDAAFNMAVDEALLQFAIQMRLPAPVIHTYGWKIPAVTFGCFQPYRLLPAFVEEMAPHDHRDFYHVVRRPTGGGWVWHQDDITFSVIMPVRGFFERHTYRQSYERIHSICMKALLNLNSSLYMQDNLSPENLIRQSDESQNACFTRPVRADLMLDGKKIMGGAQLRRRGYLLYQGTLQTKMLQFEGVHTKEVSASQIHRDIVTAFKGAFLLKDTTTIKIEDWISFKDQSLLLDKYSSESWTKKI